MMKTTRHSKPFAWWTDESVKSSSSSPPVITSSNPYVIDRGTVIQTDPTITGANGTVDEGRFFREERTDGPFSTWLFTATSQFDQNSGFEVDFDALSVEAPGPAAYRDLTSLPAVLQDIAVVAPEEVSAADVVALVRDAGGELLVSARVFDVYAGEQVGAGNRSLAVRLEFRAADRTLTDEEVAALRDVIESALGSIGGRLRG